MSPAEAHHLDLLLNLDDNLSKFGGDVPEVMVMAGMVGAADMLEVMVMAGSMGVADTLGHIKDMSLEGDCIVGHGADASLEGSCVLVDSEDRHTLV
jgi:hypothetical protein